MFFQSIWMQVFLATARITAKSVAMEAVFNMIGILIEFW